MLQKGVYPYEYTKDWGKFNAKFLPTKETFYSNLNMESITDLDNRHSIGDWVDFDIKNVGEYHEL